MDFTSTRELSLLYGAGHDSFSASSDSSDEAVLNPFQATVVADEQVIISEIQSLQLEYSQNLPAMVDPAEDDPEPEPSESDSLPNASLPTRSLTFS
jgi:hypothetical protein